MGKGDEVRNVGGSVGSQGLEQNEEPRLRCIGSRLRRLLGLKCILIVLLSLGVILSALFWLPPFLQFADLGDLDLDSRFKGHDIVASFNLEKPVNFLNDNISQLVNDIFDEIPISSTKVVVLYLEPSGSNKTQVVFAVDHEEKNSKISPLAKSLVKESFEYLVTHQSLRLTQSLFGHPFNFEVLKFTGGITVIPPQNAFLLQRVQILFNFTLIASIQEVQLKFDALKSELKSGINLAPYENLYMSLSNAKGSTVDPPTIVQSSVLLAIGNTPSIPRLKQLAQTITGSNSKNLGLNNTVFGRVKEVSLSSVLQHSLHGGDGSAPTGSPSAAPLLHPHQSHHHRHHHHHHHHGANLAHAAPPSRSTEHGAPLAHHYAPDPRKSLPEHHKNHAAQPPSGCQLRNRTSSKGTRQVSHSAPASAPGISPHHSDPSPKHTHQASPAPPPKHQRQISHPVPISSPLPVVAYAHAHPPSKSESNEQHPSIVPSVSPSPSTSSTPAGLRDVKWMLSVLLAIILQLL